MVKVKSANISSYSFAINLRTEGEESWGVCLCVHVRLWGSDMNKSILALEQVCTKCCEGTKERTINCGKGWRRLSGQVASALALGSREEVSWVKGREKCSHGVLASFILFKDQVQREQR